jgi:SAM-dependent methyltransferase
MATAKRARNKPATGPRKPAARRKAPAARRDVRLLVKDAYAGVARRQCGCDGGPTACCTATPYTVADHPVPESELGVSCGNPVAFTLLKAGNIVLDLGSGGGKDVFLAALRVGPKGRVIGVDMTPEMIALARRNAEAFRDRTGLDNVEFRQGYIEKLPIGANTVDVAISNCVINLSPDKARVFREIHRVLKPGGRMVVSDIVLNRPIPAKSRASASLYAACVAGALLRTDYLRAIQKAGFASTGVVNEHDYAISPAGDDPAAKKAAAGLRGAAASVTVVARKRQGSGITPGS